MRAFLILITLFSSCHAQGIQHKADKMCEQKYGGTQIAHIDSKGNASCERLYEDQLRWCLLKDHKCKIIPDNK